MSISPPWRRCTRARPRRRSVTQGEFLLGMGSRTRRPAWPRPTPAAATGSPATSNALPGAGDGRAVQGAGRRSARLGLPAFAMPIDFVPSPAALSASQTLRSGQPARASATLPGATRPPMLQDQTGSRSVAVLEQARRHPPRLFHPRRRRFRRHLRASTSAPDRMTTRRRSPRTAAGSPPGWACPRAGC